MTEIRILKQIDGICIKLCDYSDGSYSVYMDGVSSITVPPSRFFFPVDVKSEIISAVKYIEEKYNREKTRKLQKQKEIDDIVEAV